MRHVSVWHICPPRCKAIGSLSQRSRTRVEVIQARNSIRVLPTSAPSLLAGPRVSPARPTASCSVTTPSPPSPLPERLSVNIAFSFFAFTALNPLCSFYVPCLLWLFLDPLQVPWAAITRSRGPQRRKWCPTPTPYAHTHTHAPPPPPPTVRERPALPHAEKGGRKGGRQEGRGVKNSIKMVSTQGTVTGSK